MLVCSMGLFRKSAAVSGSVLVTRNVANRAKLGSLLAISALLITGCSSSSDSGSSSGAGASVASAPASPTPTDTSWIPAGFTGTVTGDPNLVWKKTNTSGDPAYDKEWCSWLNCFYYRVAINENCSSVTGTLQELNALGEVEDSVQASSAGSLTPGQTATLVFEPSSEWSGSTKLASLGCLP